MGWTNLGTSCRCHECPRYRMEHFLNMMNAWWIFRFLKELVEECPRLTLNHVTQLLVELLIAES